MPNTGRPAQIFTWDITPGDTVIADHFNSAIIGTVATTEWPEGGTAADGIYTGTYTTGYSFRFRENRKVWIRIPK